MTNLPPLTGDGSAAAPAVPSHGPGSSEPGLAGAVLPDAPAAAIPAAPAFEAPAALAYAPPAAPVYEAPGYAPPAVPAFEAAPAHGAGDAPVYAPPIAYSAPAAAQPPAAPAAYPYTWQEDIPSARIGVVAFVVSLAVFALSAIASVLLGSAIGALSGTDGVSDVDILAAGAGIGLLAHGVLGTLFGLWAIVQGIVAIVKKRGRGYGVAAVVIAVLAPIVSFIIFTMVGAMSSVAAQ